MLRNQQTNSPNVQPEQFPLSLMALTELGTFCLAVNQFKVAAGANPSPSALARLSVLWPPIRLLQQDMQKVTGMSEWVAAEW